MPKKTFTPEQIVAKPRQIEVLMSQGKTAPQACKEVRIVEDAYGRQRKKIEDDLCNVETALLSEYREFGVDRIVQFGKIVLSDPRT